MNQKTVIQEVWDSFPYRQKWIFSIMWLVLLDTLLTKYALKFSHFSELNPIIQSIADKPDLTILAINLDQFTLLILIKSMVLIMIFILWYEYFEGSKFDEIVVNYLSIIGILVISWNIIMLFGGQFL